jgi:hypothetical protein
MKGTLKGIVVGSICSTLVLISATALAGSGIGDVFNLGQTNTVDAQSTLTGSNGNHELKGQNTGSGRAIGGFSGSGQAIYGHSNSQIGVVGESNSFDGVWGQAHKSTVAGVSGHNDAGGFGVWAGTTGGGTAVSAHSPNGRGVAGFSGTWQGVFGHSSAQVGVVGESAYFDGVWGQAHQPTVAGVSGHNDAGGFGVWGGGGTGVYGRGGTGVSGEGSLYGVYGLNNASLGGIAVNGDALGNGGIGTAGYSGNGDGVRGKSTTGRGVYGESNYFQAVSGYSFHNAGVYGATQDGFAGYFNGRLEEHGTLNVYGDAHVTGTLTAAVKNFRIDDPLDPARNYLVHASVESSELMDVYSGNARTDSRGYAVVRLPRWFQALNSDFRYQLTILGDAPWDTEARIWQEIAHDHFTIRTNRAFVRVSWQVTGIRHDPWARAHPIVVEQPKPAAERGTYLDPSLYGKARSSGLAAERAARARPNRMKGRVKPPRPNRISAGRAAGDEGRKGMG